MTFLFFRKSAVWLAILFLSVATLLGACGDNSASTISNGAAPGSKTSAASTTSAASKDAANEIAAGAPAQPAKPGTTPIIAERKIIRNASLSLQVNDIEESLAKLRRLAVEQGGFVFSENTTQLPGDLPKSVIVLQVPAETYETTVNRIRSEAVKVIKHESSSQDVTEEFVDVQSQITNLRKTEESIQKLLDKANNLTEITNLQKELTAIRGEIERRQGRLNFLDKKSALSTISIELMPVPAPAFANSATPVATPQPATWQPEKTVNESWDASLRILGTVGTTLLRIVIFTWWILPFGLLLFFWLRRQARQRRQHPRPVFNAPNISNNVGSFTHPGYNTNTIDSTLSNPASPSVSESEPVASQQN